jgi:hypothetical protein
MWAFQLHKRRRDFNVCAPVSGGQRSTSTISPCSGSDNMSIEDGSTPRASASRVPPVLRLLLRSSVLRLESEGTQVISKVVLRVLPWVRRALRKGECVEIDALNQKREVTRTSQLLIAPAEEPLLK